VQKAEEDWGSVMSSTEMNIKRAIFKLNKITGKTDLHTDIVDTTTKFDVIPGVISYARLPMADKKGPLTLTFRYSKGSDLSASLSQVKLLPDHMNCQVHRQKPHTMEVRNLTSDFLYMSFATQKGVSFTVEYKFNDYVRNDSSRVSYRSPAMEKMATLPTIEELPVSKDLLNMNRTNS